MGDTRKKATEAIVNQLKAEGQRIIESEMQKVSYTHRTHNLHDSYGWCVYVGGKIVAEGYTDKKAGEPRRFKGEELWGSDEIRALFRSEYKPTSAIELAVGVAMPYGRYVHNKKYEVFAIAAQSVKDASVKLGARYEAVGWIR